jgi:hypothetical protein
MSETTSLSSLQTETPVETTPTTTVPAEWLSILVFFGATLGIAAIIFAARYNRFIPRADGPVHVDVEAARRREAPGPDHIPIEALNAVAPETRYQDLDAGSGSKSPLDRPGSFIVW